MTRVVLDHLDEKWFREAPRPHVFLIEKKNTAPKKRFPDVVICWNLELPLFLHNRGFSINSFFWGGSEYVDTYIYIYTVYIYIS